MAAKTRSAPMTPTQALPIPPEASSNSAALRTAARRVSQLYDGVLAPTGLRTTHMTVMIHVARQGEPTLSELAALLALDRSALSDHLKPLIREGLAAVRPCEMDKRGRRVRLTDTGHDKLADMIALWRVAQRRFDAAFGAEQAAALRAALSRIADDSFLAAFEKAS